MSNQNIFDNEVFFEGYSELRSRELNANTMLEQPAMKELLPEICGKVVLDLGCGCGHNCFDFVNSGAKNVVGVDISEKMLSVAKAESAHEKIEYVNMSMTDISKLNQKFDLVYSSLAFHYIEDFKKLCEDIYSLLNSGGYLLFSQEHPLITATVDGKGHYNKDENGIKVSYTFSNYNEPGERKVHWYVDGVTKYHRPFADIINALSQSGFVIEEISEPQPQHWAMEKWSALYDEFIKPSFLIVKAKKGIR